MESDLEIIRAHVAVIRQNEQHDPDGQRVADAIERLIAEVEVEHTVICPRCCELIHITGAK